MNTFKIKEGEDYIELCQLLKLEGPFSSGGEAKQAIIAGIVSVDGVVETRKKCKIRSGQRVTCGDVEILVE